MLIITRWYLANLYPKTKHSLNNVIIIINETEQSVRDFLQNSNGISRVILSELVARESVVIMTYLLVIKKHYIFISPS